MDTGRGNQRTYNTRMELGGGFVLRAVLLAAVAELVGRATAATYVVGDNLGWNVPSSVDEYSSWASRHVFTPGDVLMFNFVTGEHDVAEVRKAAYDECSSNDPIVLSTVGPWNTTLNSTGQHYYICTFGRHCSLGQKLAINVTAPSPTPPPMLPTPTPTPASTPPSPTPMSGSPSPIPPPTQMPRSPSPTPSSTPTPMSGSPSPTPSPTPMSGSPSSTPSPAPMPGSPGGSPLPGTPGGAPTTPGELSPPPGNTATLPTVSVTLVVLVSVAFGLIM